MNRIIAPALLFIAISISSAAIAAPSLKTPSDVRTFFDTQLTNGN